MAPISTPPVDIVGLAHSYRRLVLLVGAQILVGVGFLTAAAAGVLPVDDGSETWQWVGERIIPGLVLALGTVQVIYAYQTARDLGSIAPFVWAIAMFIPCVSPIVLLILSARATQACRDWGVRVGFLGPDLEGARRQGIHDRAENFVEAPDHDRR